MCQIGTNLFLLRSLIEACDKGEVKGDGNWVSEKEARYWNCVALLAYEDGERGGDIVHRVLEYWLDCGTRTGGWEIHPAGPSREDWERFKWESDFYKAWGELASQHCVILMSGGPG